MSWHQDSCPVLRRERSQGEGVCAGDQDVQAAGVRPSGAASPATGRRPAHPVPAGAGRACCVHAGQDPEQSSHCQPR